MVIPRCVIDGAGQSTQLSLSSYKGLDYSHSQLQLEGPASNQTYTCALLGILPGYCYQRYYQDTAIRDTSIKGLVGTSPDYPPPLFAQFNKKTKSPVSSL